MHQKSVECNTQGCTLTHSYPHHHYPCSTILHPISQTPSHLPSPLIALLLSPGIQRKSSLIGCWRTLMTNPMNGWIKLLMGFVVSTQKKRGSYHKQYGRGQGACLACVLHSSTSAVAT